jgi:hypothetical protein
VLDGALGGTLGMMTGARKPASVPPRENEVIGLLLDKQR